MIPKFISRFALIIVLVFLVIGLWEMNSLSGSEEPIYKNAIDAIQDKDFTFLLQFLRMYWGWGQITPAIPVSDFPWYFSWYGFYYSLFIPSGYFAIVGIEVALFLALIFLGLFIFSRILKKRSPTNSIPIWFYSLFILIPILLYPIWVWVNLHWFFIPGASAVFGITSDEAYSIWLNFNESIEGFTFLIITVTLMSAGFGVKYGSKAFRR